MRKVLFVFLFTILLVCFQQYNDLYCFHLQRIILQVSCHLLGVQMFRNTLILKTNLRSSFMPVTLSSLGVHCHFYCNNTCLGCDRIDSSGIYLKSCRNRNCFCARNQTSFGMFKQIEDLRSLLHAQMFNFCVKPLDSFF